MDAVASRRPDVSFDIDTQPVGKPGLHDQERPRIGQRPAINHVEGQDVVVASGHARGRGVGHVQHGFVGREGQPVRVLHRVADNAQLATFAIEAEDEAEGQLRIGAVALGVVEDPVRRIGEPDRAV